MQKLVWFGFNPLKCFFGSEGHVALDRNPGPGYDTLLLRMIPGDLLSAFPHRQFHTLPGLLDSWAALPNSNPNACMPMQGGSLYHFYDGLWCDPAGRRTHDLPCERRTRYRLSQPDTVAKIELDFESHKFGFMLFSKMTALHLGGLVVSVPTSLPPDRVGLAQSVACPPLAR